MVDYTHQVVTESYYYIEVTSPLNKKLFREKREASSCGHKKELEGLTQNTYKDKQYD